MRSVRRARRCARARRWRPSPPHRALPRGSSLAEVVARSRYSTVCSFTTRTLSWGVKPEADTVNREKRLNKGITLFAHSATKRPARPVSSCRETLSGSFAGRTETRPPTRACAQGRSSRGGRSLPLGVLPPLPPLLTNFRWRRAGKRTALFRRRCHHLHFLQVLPADCAGVLVFRRPRPFLILPLFVNVVEEMFSEVLRVDAPDSGALDFPRR